ncbi:MAG: CBS domain-containing protein [Gammaproteobacteria bacterium]|nr:CBS domain-containing protein [Gammaproteobacteria bacterium]MDH5799736.1 CBS domain-containing protein [Gammaproteobacteria bacterium]
MNDINSSSAVSKDGRQRPSWLERFSQALMIEPKDREQLITILRNARKRNLLDIDALPMIEGVLDVSEMQVRDVMIPRAQMVVVNQDVPPEEFLPIIVESAHSRFPVIGDSRDEVVGILLAKDLLPYFADKEQEFNIRDMLRPAVFIPESKRLNVLLREFRASRNHMAIVVDEYGGVSGLVTIEDVLEQIVGDIEDEHDFEHDLYIVKHSDNRYTVKAITPIDEFNSEFDTSLCDDEFDTIGGLLSQEFGRVPARGEEASIGRFKFKVLRADSRRAHLLQMSVDDGNGTQVEDLASN